MNPAMQGMGFSSNFTVQEPKILFLSLSLSDISVQFAQTGGWKTFDYRQCCARAVLLRLMRMECAHFLPTLLLMVLVSSQAHWEYSHYGNQQTQQVRDLCFPFDLLWRVWINICQHTTVCLLPFFAKFQGWGSPWSQKWSEVKITQLCLILCNPMNYTIHGIL